MLTLTGTAATTVRAGGCRHHPPCPAATAPDHGAARVVFHDHRVGFSLLCNGVEVFDDTGEILPDATTIPPHRPRPPHRPAA
jgi:Family of unknown function (DUF5999)